MHEWQSFLARLYDYFEEHDKKTSLIQDIDRTILRGDRAPLEFALPFVERLLDRVDADGVLFFQREGGTSFALRDAFPRPDRQLPARLATADLPEISDLLQRAAWQHSDAWIPPEANCLLCEQVVCGDDPWAILLFYWRRPVVASQGFIADVVSQLSIGVHTLISRERLEYFRTLHSRFFEKDLDQKECLEVVRDKTLAILARHTEPILLQILFTEPIAPGPRGADRRRDEPLVIRWSSNGEEVGIRVPLDSFSGRAMESGKPYLLGDPTTPEFAATYKAFTGNTRTELAMVLRKDAGAEPLGVLNLESPRLDAFSPDEIESIRALVELVSPMLAAVRRRVTMARTEKVLAAVAVNQSLDRLGRLYAHKFRTLQLGLDTSLTLARSLLDSGRPGEAALKLGSMGEDLADFNTSHNDLWRSIKSVSRLGPVRLSIVVAELAKEERVTSERYLEFDLPFIEQMPPVRASGLLKEHLRNLLNNAVRAIEKRAAAESSEYKGRIWITAVPHAHTQSGVRHGRDDIAELNQRVRISVRDNGLGLTPDFEEKIFEIGYTTWGTGFGLAAARQYARELGGNVWANGGDGCVITIELPVFVEDDDSEPEVDHY